MLTKVKNFLKKWLVEISGIILISTIIILVILWWQVDRYWVTLLQEAPSTKINDVFGSISAYGSVASAVIALTVGVINVILLVRTLTLQRELFNDQKIENRFFEFLQYHRENTERVSLTVVHHNNPNNVSTLTGYRAFAQLGDEFAICRKNVRDYFTKKRNGIIIQGIDKSLFMDQISYLIFYFGIEREWKFYQSQRKVGENGQYTEEPTASLMKTYNMVFKHSPLCTHLSRTLQGSILQDEITNVENILSEILSIMIETRYNNELHRLGMHKEKFGENRSSVLIKPDIPISINFLFGVRTHLGHYYRHLIQTVRYVNETSLQYNEKNNLVKKLRAQLSDSEQQLLYYNSLSILGQAWEFKGRTSKEYYCKVRSDANISDYNNECLITKYNLIANITNYGNIEDESTLSWVKYYPLIKYESESVDDVPNRRTLEKLFT